MRNSLNLIILIEMVYEGNYKEIVISITKMMYSKYSVIIFYMKWDYMKGKNYAKMIATKIAYKL